MLIIGSYGIKDSHPSVVSGLHFGHTFTSNEGEFTFSYVKTNEDGTSTVEFPEFIPPSDGYLCIETSYVNLLPYGDTFSSKVDKSIIEAIKIYKYSIIGSKYNKYGFPITTCGIFFNNDYCFEGFRIYHTSLGLHTTGLVIFYNDGQSINLTSISPTHLSLSQLHPSHGYVAPPTIFFRIGGTIYKLRSDDELGFTYGGLVSAISSHTELSDKSFEKTSDGMYTYQVPNVDTPVSPVGTPKSSR